MTRQLVVQPMKARTKGEVKRLRLEGYIPISLQHRGEPTLHLQQAKNCKTKIIQKFKPTSHNKNYQ